MDERNRKSRYSIRHPRTSSQSDNGHSRSWEGVKELLHSARLSFKNAGFGLSTYFQRMSDLHWLKRRPNDADANQPFSRSHVDAEERSEIIGRRKARPSTRERFVCYGEEISQPGLALGGWF
jgi:hypothetical protein